MENAMGAKQREARMDLRERESYVRSPATLRGDVPPWNA